MTKFLRALVATASLLSVSQASAVVLFSDNFDYIPGEAFAGQNGGSGFSGGWATNATTSLGTTTYSYDVSGGGTVAGGSAGLTIQTQAGTQIPVAIQRGLDESYSGDDVYISFVLRQTGGAVTNGDRFDLWLGNTAAASGPYGGLLQVSSSGFYVRTDSGSSAGLTVPRFAVNTTYLVVLHFSKSVSGSAGTYDQASIWVNPTASSSSAPNAKSTTAENTAFSISSFSMIGVEVKNASTSTDSGYYLGSVVAGTTWEDVVPAAVPEPSTVAISLLGGIALLVYGRKRRIC